ncbi:Putative ribonuclease H protein [Dendrobium catenatum]|uniref:Ribonuclease H protein n=1 Tax=Dendrobium catenatum TaxID=906689 RepID=A0A2I0W6Y9_9ASPA|nr:Putative ribonuclease H protein [Dendrobium catenatum]
MVNALASFSLPKALDKVIIFPQLLLLLQLNAFLEVLLICMKDIIILTIEHYVVFLSLIYVLLMMLLFFLNRSLNMIIVLTIFLHNFEIRSRLTLNKNKCFFIATKNIADDCNNDVRYLTSFIQGFLPLEYLGVPLFKGCKLSFLFDELITSVLNRLNYWESNFLSFGGRLILIKIVLCSLPIYIFQTIQRTLAVCNRLEKLFSKFFWKGNRSNFKIFWTTWSNCYGLLEEGALGCKNMADLAYAFSIKLCFNFHAKSSLGAKYMDEKLCGKASYLMHL